MKRGATHVSVLGAILGGAFGRNLGRLVLSMLAIAVGVALGFAVQLINQAAIGEFAGSMATLSGSADLEVRGPRSGFDEDLFPILANDPEIAVASAVVEVDARIKGRDDSLPLLGIDAFRAASVTPALLPDAGDPIDLLREDRIFLSPAAASWLGASAGDTVTLQSGLRDVTLVVAGLVGSGSTQKYGVMDIAAAQENFDRVGRLNRIDLRVRPGAGVGAVLSRLQPSLPPGVAVAPPQVRVDATTRMSRAYRINLNVLALVALFTGGLLVFSTQALSVVRRRAQFALLRTLGLSRRRLVSLLLVEGAAIGAAGALLGLLAGYLLAGVILRVFGSDLGAGFFRGVTPDVAVEPVAALTFGTLGVLAAVLGGFFPALEAARAAPAAALKAGDEQAAFRPLRRPGPGVALLAAGVVCAMLPPVADLPLFGYLAIALLLFGTLLLMPRLSAFLFARIPTPRHAAAALAFHQLRGASGQAAVSLTTIVASVSLMVAMAIMVGSFRQSLDDWLARILPADLYVRSGMSGDSAWFGAEDQRRFVGIAGVLHVDFLRTQMLVLDPARARVVLLARDLPADDPGRALPLLVEGPSRAARDPPPVWVSEAIADLYGYTVGSRITLPLAGRAVPFVVAGVWRDYARQQGAMVIDRSLYAALTGDATANDAALWLAPDAKVDAVRRELEERFGGDGKLTFAAPGEIRAISLRVFDRTFAVTYALEAAAVGLGLIGLSSSFGALVFARRREFGMLRHLGLTRRQIAGMLATEGLLVSGVGLVVGMVLGWLMSLILIFVVNRQSFHWSMDLHVPWGPLLALALSLLALATATTLVSARGAMAGDAIRAVKDDW
ncbi:MAG TPA: FtsX-like permease family protein [Casimicrobiaceae bacterium]|nr:FtsX-like permease family protein [Casimicrobiaceae bacterium]